MLNIFIGITSLLFLSCITLNLIGYRKNYLTIEKYTRIISYPLILISCILLLVQHLPDSKNIIFLLSLALICLTVSNIFSSFIKKQSMLILIVTTFVVSNICWIIILFPSIYLYQYSKLFIILYFLVYFSITACILLKIIKVDFCYNSILAIVSLISVSILNFFSIITLTDSFHLYSILIFLGTSLLYLPNYIFTESILKKTENEHNMISRITFYSSEILLCTGFVLMII